MMGSWESVAHGGQRSAAEPHSNRSRGNMVEYGRIWSEGSSLISEVDESSSYQVPGKHRSTNAHQVGRNAVNQI